MVAISLQACQIVETHFQGLNLASYPISALLTGNLHPQYQSQSFLCERLVAVHWVKEGGTTKSKVGLLQISADALIEPDSRLFLSEVFTGAIPGWRGKCGLHKVIPAL